MADRVLSQDEVDALMKGVSNGDIETETDKAADADGVTAYDLSSQDRVIRGRMPTLEIINERFCRFYRVSLFNLIRKVADVNMEGVRMMKYGEFLKNIPVPTSLNMFKFPPLRGLSLLVFDANLVFLIVDNYFGGGGKIQAKIEGREFSSLEQRIIMKLVDLAFADMKKSWRSVYPVEFVYDRSEVNPQFANVVVPTEVVIVSTFDIEIDMATSKMSLCIPYSSIEPIKEKLYTGYQSDRMEVDKRWLLRLEEEIKKTTLYLSCDIGKARISMQDLLNLNVGDVIELDNRISDPVNVKVEGITKFMGRPGLAGGRYAVQICGSYPNG